ncbi:MAG TPA: hypothetical protein VEC60_19075 [Reyranella sp.]|nr:hypothetical protein [Reyranella sp.]
MQDRDTTPEVERNNRQAALEKRIGDPHAIEPRDSRPLIVMACLALAVAVVAGTLMWTNNSRYDGTSGTPIAEQPNPPEAPQRQQ